ncbi:hypothetical protein NMY22_g15781 [Coprinellus aureogranulatus]|nr:hypothetical protein NMY22_g15781 [Coprinellus aureogranulatus]
MSDTTKETPVETIPSLSADDGRVTSPQLPEDYKAPRGSWSDGEIGAAFGEVLYAIWDALTPSMAEDDAARGRFTKGLVSALHDVWPNFNFITVHTAHTISFDGKEGESWGRGRGVLPTFWYGNLAYDVYYCRSGIFVLHGDGGYQNWAWYGRIKQQSSDGRILIFN